LCGSTLKATVSTSASAGAWITLKVKRFWTPFGCVPWGAGLIDVGVQGQASADATLEATGSFKINGGNPWTYSKLIAAPKVAEFPFAVGPIPIALAISVPIETGFTVDAATTAALKGKVHAEGSFKYSCTLDNGCDGTKDFSAGFTPNGDPSGQAASKVNVEPWVQGSIRLGASVLTAEVAYAQIGVRPGVSLDLRAYAGNTCGDANGDGTVDAVAGASIDMGARVDLIAKVGALGESKEWSYRLLDKHLGFFKTGTTNAPWSPMYRVKGTDDLNATISLGTRPCWPYTDPVTYQITWDDGTTSSGTQGPGMHDVSHTFKGYGGHPFTVALQSDSSGRSLGTSAAANVYLKVIQQAPNHGLSMSTK
jgi:hypothetical protein